MNKKLRQVINDTATLAVFLTVIIVGIGALVYTGSIDLDLDSNQTVNDTVNESGLNQSEYYDTEDKVCQSPDINDTNASQFKACVTNQTSVS